MSNEILLALSALTSVTSVFLAARMGSHWLYGVILLNLVLISTFGAKLIEVFGLVTNVGNVFYACVFFATHFFLMRGDRKSALRTVWFGAGFVILFILMSQFVIGFQALIPDAPANIAIRSLFVLSPRIALASITAYVFAQHTNIRIYEWIATRTRRKHLWLQSNGANIIAQLLDSAIFFTIAFVDLSGYQLIQAIIAGWCIKTVVVLAGTPFLYLDGVFSQKQRDV